MTTLIHNCTAVLMDEARTVLKNAFVAVDGAVITSVGTVRPQGSFDREIDGGGNVLMPGFVNAHAHLPMTLMRGYGGGCDLHQWLQQYIFPAEAKLTDRAVHAAAALGLSEMIASGITTVADMYDHCDAIAQEAAAAGVNANIARGLNLFAPDFDPKKHQGCVETKELVEKWHGYNDGQILIDACIHGEYTSRDVLWDWCAAFAKEHGLGMHVHLSETRSEHEECVARHGMTPAAVFERHGIFDVRAIAAHCVWTTPEDWEILARHGVSAIHNPMSNLKLGSGIAPIPAMIKAGVNVCLGTDGVSSNNATDFFADMKLAAILHNGASCDPMAMGPYEALRLATVNGAKALGRNTGEIKAGCTADLILVDFTAPNNIPCHDAVENLVYASHGGNVLMNMARGKVIYQNGEFLTIDMEKVRREIDQYAMPLLFG